MRPGAFRAPMNSDVQGNGRNVSKRRGEQVVQLTVALVIRIRNRRLYSNQFVRFCNARDTLEHDAVHLAVGTCSDADAETERDHCYSREAGRPGKDAKSLPGVLPE